MKKTTEPIDRIRQEYKTLTEKVRVLLLEGVNRVGSYDPDEVFPFIEEKLTPSEYVTAYSFLTWVVQSKKKFGHANIHDVFKEWAEQ